jgi:hypothetical protein
MYEMSYRASAVRVYDAFDDLLRRTLSKIPCDLGRLIYLASTRDYNTGTYHHEGLSARHPGDGAREALQAAHRDVFCRLASSTLEELVGQLEMYVQSSHERPEELVRTWQELEPYRIAIPMHADPTMVQLFLSNIRIALEVLRFRQKPNPVRPSDASRLPSPAR